MALTSDIAAEVAAKVSKPPFEAVTMAGPSDDAHMADVHEEEVVYYEGSTGEEPTKLSSDVDDSWDFAADTSLKFDTSKFSHLTVEDLKAINALDVDTPSQVEGNATLLLVYMTRYGFSKS